MKTELSKFSLLILSLILVHGVFIAQVKQSFTVDCVRAKFTDTTGNKDVVVIFNVSVKDTANYPPVLNLPPKCSIQVNGTEQNVLLSPENLFISLFDDKVILKDVTIYELVRDRVDLNSKNKILLISMKIKDVSSENFNKMKVTLTLGEKHNRENRFQKPCEFIVER